MAWTHRGGNKASTVHVSTSCLPTHLPKSSSCRQRVDLRDKLWDCGHQILLQPEANYGRGRPDFNCNRNMQFYLKITIFPTEVDLRGWQFHLFHDLNFSLCSKMNLNNSNEKGIKLFLTKMIEKRGFFAEFLHSPFVFSRTKD